MRPASLRTPSSTLRLEAASAIAMALAAVVALVLANAGGAEAHARWLAWPQAIALGERTLPVSLRAILDEGFMTLVFLVLGLRLRRELGAARLHEHPAVLLSIAAAIGGVVVPALVYLALVPAGPAERGWVVTMGTDVAVAAAAIVLLGPRLPPTLRVLVLAAALLADVGAVLVGAVLHVERLVPRGLVVTAIGVILALGMRDDGVRHPLPFVIPGLVTWGGLYYAGLHPALAGAVMGLLAPTDPGFGRAPDDPPAADARSPAERVLAWVHPAVALVVLPLYVLAHAGVALDGAWAPSVVVGVLVAMVVGKPLGVAVGLASGTWIAGRFAPSGTRAALDGRGAALVGAMAGAGLSMSLFLAERIEASPELLASARLGALGASLICVAMAVVLGRVTLPRSREGATTEPAARCERASGEPTARVTPERMGTPQPCTRPDTSPPWT